MCLIFLFRQLKIRFRNTNSNIVQSSFQQRKIIGICCNMNELHEDVSMLNTNFKTKVYILSIECFSYAMVLYDDRGQHGDNQH